jgi:hypothetical protein
MAGFAHSDLTHLAAASYALILMVLLLALLSLIFMSVIVRLCAFPGCR